MRSMKNENPILLDSPSVLKAFFWASRPKTWIAGISPVCIGTSMAPRIDPAIFALTLCFSLFIQIGTNYANDYFDFINGADTHLRNGPKRATQQGWISQRSMWMASLCLFGCALVAAIPLMISAGLWSLFAAAACVAFGILYTGGPKPLGYLGLGELLVFFFFGPVAVCGTFFLQTGETPLSVGIASCAPGLLSCSILIANNLRDEKTDRAAGKRTLIVRFGRRFGSWEYTLSIGLAALVPLILFFMSAGSPRILACPLVLMAAIPSIRKAFLFKNPLELVGVLERSALLLVLYTGFFCAASF